MKTEPSAAEHIDPRVEERTERRALLRRALLWSLGVFLVLRLALSLISLAGVGLLPRIDNEVGVTGWEAHRITGGPHNLVTAWERFDALWFLRIASDGYVSGDGSAAFFPGYPLAIRGVSTVLGDHPLAAALLISNLAAFGSFVILYLLTAHELDEGIARRAVVYLAVFPTSFFLLAPYSESLFLLFVLLALWGARRRRWALAAAAAAAAAATRNLGILLVVPLAVEAFHQWRERRTPLIASLPWAAGPIVGVAPYLLFWQSRAGDWLAPLHQQATWQRTGSAPWSTIWDATVLGFKYIGTYPGGYHLLDWLVVAPALAFAVWVAARMRPVYSTYVWASLLAPLSFVFIPRPFMSLPRFLLPLFPILWAPAMWGRRRRGVHEAVVGISAALLGLMTVLFVNWYYVF